MRDEIAEFKQDWNLLIEHTQREKPDLVLLPEMGFSPGLQKTQRLIQRLGKDWIDGLPADAWLLSSPGHTVFLRIKYL